jgi:cytochrome c peroxidase
MNRQLICATLVLLVACDRSSISGPPALVESTLDIELRQSIGPWGVVPIGPMPVQNAALVSLGQSLFFDKILSGNRDVSCGTCHDPLATVVDGLSLSVGTGGAGMGPTRTVGSGRRFVPRNAPSLLNTGLGFSYTLWDGRVNQEGGWGGGPATFKAPAGVVFPAGLANIVAAQAMLPVLNRTEMRGERGDVDVFGKPNELADVSDAAPADVWKAVMGRVLAIQDYATKFAAAYPGVPASTLGFQHAANAIAAFQMHSFTRTNSAFDRFMARDTRAMTDDQKRGAILFFGRARCASCHFGPMLGGQTFANAGVPQIGPGVGAAAPLDIGRAEHIPVNQGQEFYKFSFRVPQLRNVELTAPYMHNGAYRTLETVLRHYTNPDSAQRAYDVSELDPALQSTYHGDAATTAAVLKTLDGRLRQGIKLTEDERRQIVAFLKSLTDPAAKDLSAAIPASVPSGLPVR